MPVLHGLCLLYGGYNRNKWLSSLSRENWEQLPYFTCGSDLMFKIYFNKSWLIEREALGQWLVWERKFKFCSNKISLTTRPTTSKKWLDSCNKLISLLIQKISRISCTQRHCQWAGVWQGLPSQGQQTHLIHIWADTCHWIMLPHRWISTT